MFFVCLTLSKSKPHFPRCQKFALKISASAEDELDQNMQSNDFQHIKKISPELISTVKMKCSDKNKYVC